MINTVLFPYPIHPNVIYFVGFYTFIPGGFLSVWEDCFVLQNLVLVSILIDSLLSFCCFPP